jgi:hypothetical protein
MATTTPNFGWVVPTSTDLVKDGATAIETLGDSIDASLLDLKGGTTGQVLAKNSATDMDFVWTAIDPLVILDAKGDLITATAADTPARLAVGTNGQVLTADSTVGTGLKWASPVSGAYTLLSTTTLSGSNQVISSIDQTYKHLFVLVTGMTNATGDGALRQDCNSNASSAFYSRTGQVGYTASTGAAGGDQFSPMVNTVDRTSAVNAVAVMYFDYATAGVHPFTFQSGYVATGGALESVNGGGAIRFGTAAAISSIRFHNYGGGFSTGTVKIYGVN